MFGEGPARSKIVFVGEQPGDQEDLSGHPFVGPAGKLLNRALLAAGIDRAQTYVTNAVKHFKFEPRGKRRLHKKPSDAEIAACNHWLQDEIRLINPRLIVTLGVTAAKGVLQRPFTISQNRGKLLDYPLHSFSKVVATVHPSFLLRVPEEEKQHEFELFVSDLKLAPPFLK